jgi:hypothetical protein
MVAQPVPQYEVAAAVRHRDTIKESSLSVGGDGRETGAETEKRPPRANAKQPPIDLTEQSHDYPAPRSL